MKQYRLINRKTGEETLCTKVVEGCFDYYYIDTIKNTGYCYRTDTNSIHKTGALSSHYVGIENTGGVDIKLCKEIICTNNPSIDIGQVIDEVDEWIIQTLKDANIQNGEIVYKTAKLSLKAGINKHSSTHTLSDDEVVEFLEWKDKLHLEYEIGLMDRGFSMYMPKNGEIKTVTSKELLQLFKEQQIKTIYYE